MNHEMNTIFIFKRYQVPFGLPGRLYLYLSQTFIKVSSVFKSKCNLFFISDKAPKRLFRAEAVIVKHLKNDHWFIQHQYKIEHDLYFLHGKFENFEILITWFLTTMLTEDNVLWCHKDTHFNGSKFELQIN